MAVLQTEPSSSRLKASEINDPFPFNSAGLVDYGGYEHRKHCFKTSSSQACASWCVNLLNSFDSPARERG